MNWSRITMLDGDGDKRDAYPTKAVAEQILLANDVLYDKVSAALGCDRGEVPVAMGEVVRFLCLAASNESGMLTPSHQVDLAWHELILCTKYYRGFCESQFGRMIHHYPGGTKEENRRQFAETLRLYQQRFGPLNETYWGRQAPLSDADCGACKTV